MDIRPVGVRQIVDAKDIGSVTSGQILKYNSTTKKFEGHTMALSDVIIAGSGLSASGNTLSLSHLGLESLSDPGGDRVLFWDETADTFKWLSIGDNLTITDTTIAASGGGGGSVAADDITAGDAAITISTTAGAVNITPAAGSAIVLDGTINVDAGVVTEATSITSVVFIGSLTGNADTATALAATRTIGMTGDVVWTSAGFDGSGNVTAVANIQTNSVDGTMIALGSDAQGDIMYYDGTNYVRLGAGTNGHFLKTQGTSANPAWASVGGGTATAVTVADESSDTACFPLFVTAATGDLGPKSGSNLAFDSSSGALTATSFVGDVTGDVTGNADTVTNGVYTSNNLSVMAATTSLQLKGVISDETGSGALVFGTNPTLVTPALGTPSALVGTNISGTAASLTAGAVTNGVYTTDSGTVSNTMLANSSITVSDGSNTSPVALGGTMTFSGTANEVTVVEAAGTVTIGLPDDVTILGDLTVSGDTTTVNTATLSVEDPLIILASGNNGSDAVDIGFYGLYDTSGSQDLYAGLFRDANDSGKFKLFKDLQAAPTTTVNISGAGYAKATLVADIEGALTGNADTVTNGVYTTNNLSVMAATTSAQLAGVISDETGSGTLVFATSPTLVTPVLGTPASGTLTNCTFPTLNQNTTGVAAIATTVTVADESSDTTCFPLFVTAATGNLGPKSGSNLAFDSSSGALTATSFVGDLTGDVAGNADTVTTNADLTGHITSTGNAAVLGSFTVAQLSTALSDASISGNNTGDQTSVSGNAATATIATNVIVSDSESDDSNHAITFVDDLDGSASIGIQSDGDLHYNPSTGTVTATVFSGSGASLTSLNGSNISSGTVAAARVATLNQNTTGTAATVTGATQAAVTSAANLATIGTVTSGTLSTGAVLAGVTVTLGSDAEGDIYYRNSGGVLTKLAAGTDGHVLTATGAGSAPAWEEVSGGGGGGDITAVSLTGDTGGALSVGSGDAGFTIAGGAGIDTSGSSTTITITTDFSEFSDVTPANGDKLATLDSDGSTEQLTTIASLATLFAGTESSTGLTASNSVLSVSSEYIADTVGAMVGSNTESGITVAYQDDDNTLDFTVGTLNQDTTGTADNFTVSANNTADETVYPVFVDGATGSQGAETDTGLTYNPSTGTVTATLFSGSGASLTALNGSNISTGTVAAARVATLNQDTTGNADTATALAATRTIGMTGDVVWTSAAFDGSGNVTGTATIQADAVHYSMLNDDCISGFDEITSGLVAADEVLYSDGGTLKRVGIDTLATKLLGLASAGDVLQTADHMVFLDGGATGDVIIESIDNFLTAIAGSGISVSSSQLTASGGGGTPTDITVADESSDTTCFPLFVTTATGDQEPKTGSNLTFNSSTGILAATIFSGSGASLASLNGSNISSGTVAAARVATLNQNTTGTAATVTTAAQPNITSVGTLASVVISDGGNIGSASDTDAIAIDADGGVIFSKAIIGSVGSGTISEDDTDITIDWATGNYHEVTLEDDDIDAVIFHNVTVGQRIIVRIQNDDSEERTVAWTVTSGTGTSPAAAVVNWAGGITPVATADTDVADVYGFICRTATKFDGFIIGQNLANTAP
jgi:hypothetical protein